MSVLVFTPEGIPLARRISLGRAIRKLERGVCYLIEAHPTQIRNASGTVSFPAPRTIGEISSHRPSRFFDPATLTNEALFLRDGETCVYCGRHRTHLRKNEKLTRDHVVPRSRGGADDWSNCATACSTCNGRKANLTPEEAGLPSPGLLAAPTRKQLEAMRRSRAEAVVAAQG